MQELLPERLPGDGGVGIGAMGLKATIELGPLGVGHRQNLRSVGEAVPEVLRELNPLRDGESAEVHDRLDHPFNIELRQAAGKRF